MEVTKPLLSNMLLKMVSLLKPFILMFQEVLVKLLLVNITVHLLMFSKTTEMPPLLKIVKMPS